ncbi:MAG TPA: DUF4232 domain-containing protein [Acidimicrobiales bacterium]|jgi:hypothetical protein|nr:DUF4232 domain-containing protein [Acidimicrobiales bacterium]
MSVPRRPPLPGRRCAVVALALGAAGLSLLPPASAPAAASPTAQKTTVASCTPSQISTSLELYTLGTSPTSPAGAVLFHNTSAKACTLRGVPTVGVLNATGQRIAVYQRSSTSNRPVAALLQPSSSGKAAGSSLTWSAWSCPAGSFSLTIRFAGWSTSVPATWTSAVGNPGGPCTVTGATLYVSTVATITH